MEEANTTFVFALTYSTRQLGRTLKANDLVMHPQFRVELLSEPNAYASSTYAVFRHQQNRREVPFPDTVCQCCR